MGMLDEARAQMRQGQAAGERAAAGRSLSADASIRMRLSVYWPAGLLAIVVAAAAWRLARLSAMAALAFGLGAGLLTTLLLTALLRVLLARAKTDRPSSGS